MNAISFSLKKFNYIRVITSITTVSSSTSTFIVVVVVVIILLIIINIRKIFPIFK